MKNPVQQSTDRQRYFVVWRWHFYAGMFVVPFLMLLAVTALGMLLMANTAGRDGERTTLQTTPSMAQVPISTQAKSALDSLPESTIVKYTAPRKTDTVALFQVQSADQKYMVAINPYTADIVDSAPAQSGLYDTFEGIHSDLLLGKVGDYLLETTASLTILMILTGWYLWWQKRKSVKAMLIPDTQTRRQNPRSLLRTIHATVGSWVSILLLFFCVSGMAWAGIWGERMVQAWSQFPAGKWGVAPMPVSTPVSKSTPATIDHSQHLDEPTALPHVHGETSADIPTHGSVLNSGDRKEVPWVLELTPMPVSGTVMGDSGIVAGVPIMIDTVDRLAREMGIIGRYQLNLPQGTTGVWSISQDSMSYDMPSPTADRTVHIDRYTGNILADIRYEDYNVFGKFMAAGIALHMGTLGWWSVLANVLFCLSVITICVSGYIMWWQRRPRDASAKLALNPPARGLSLSVWWPFAVVLLIIAALFPTAAIAIAAIVLLDVLVISRVSWLKNRLK